MSATVDVEKQEIQLLIAPMQSRGHWRDRDPAVVRTVRAGFQRLYGKPAKPSAAARQSPTEVQIAA